MKSSRKTAKFLKTRFHFEASTELDSKVKADITRALEQEEKTSTLSRQSVWRIAAGSRISKVAAAAVVVIAILLAVYDFRGPSSVKLVGCRVSAVGDASYQVLGRDV